MNSYINKLSRLYIKQRKYLSDPLVRILSHYISNSKQELPDLSLLCLQTVKRHLYGVKGEVTSGKFSYLAIILLRR